eukprot:gnl/TRDRNA2_/TRDRNA2_197544_c0_seq1.p1 gnl/TRDRNA2_/TRDRNA2_197544_c0~~gnl/TRDRNA2_/TRDRNA2_197544_c0_seq1.p1  ORF type:complete len:283 (-),score=30.79 gnl/TRDRNA2_/TRDRNA2_197544_c0_seq1:18-866(-)
MLIKPCRVLHSHYRRGLIAAALSHRPHRICLFVSGVLAAMIYIAYALGVSAGNRHEAAPQPLRWLETPDSRAEGVFVPYRCLAAAAVGSGVAISGAPSLLTSAGFPSGTAAATSLAQAWQSDFGMIEIEQGSVQATLQSVAKGGTSVVGGVMVSGKWVAPFTSFCKATDGLLAEAWASLAVQDALNRTSAVLSQGKAAVVSGVLNLPSRAKALANRGGVALASALKNGSTALAMRGRAAADSLPSFGDVRESAVALANRGEALVSALRNGPSARTDNRNVSE